MSWWNAVRDVMNPVQAISDAQKSPQGLSNLVMFGMAPGAAINGMTPSSKDGSGVTPIPLQFGALQYMNPMQALQLSPQQAAGQVTPQMLAQQPIQAQGGAPNGWLQLMQGQQPQGMLGGK